MTVTSETREAQCRLIMRDCFGNFFCSVYSPGKYAKRCVRGRVIESLPRNVWLFLPNVFRTGCHRCQILHPQPPSRAQSFILQLEIEDDAQVPSSLQALNGMFSFRWLVAGHNCKNNILHLTHETFIIDREFNTLFPEVHYHTTHHKSLISLLLCLNL